MKKVFILLFLCSASLTISAQDVYKEILKVSKAGAADTTKNLDTRRIYQFKIDELDYMLVKSRELMPDSSMAMIDRQAYAMYDYVQTFMKDLSQCKNERDKQQIITMYKEATIHNSRFNDADTELTLSYYRRDDYIIQFSLDTDWIMARNEVKKIKSKLQ